jgi:hypothetical protein
MVERYWNMMTDKKFHIVYLGLHYGKCVKIERWINIILAVISTGSLGALLVTDKAQKVWVIILALAQIVTAAKPYLPFQYRMNEIDKGLVALNMIYNDIEKEWNPIISGKYDEATINQLYYDFSKQWEKADAEMLKNDCLPQKAKLIEKANKEKNHYFEVMFGGDNND